MRLSAVLLGVCVVGFLYGAWLVAPGLAVMAACAGVGALALLRDHGEAKK